MGVIGWLWRGLGKWHWPLLWLLMPKYIVGVSGLIVNNEGEIWLQQHRFWPQQAWGLPGGIIKSHEMPSDALIREIKEETGRSCQAGPILLTQLPYRRCLTIVMSAQIGNEPLVLDKTEILDAGYFKPEALPKPMLPDHIRLVEQALRKV